MEAFLYIGSLAGISRSSTVVIAYLMQKHHWPFDMAYQHTKKCRPFISPNPGFQSQLLLYEKNESQNRYRAPELQGIFGK